MNLDYDITVSIVHDNILAGMSLNVVSNHNHKLFIGTADIVVEEGKKFGKICLYQQEMLDRFTEVASMVVFAHLPERAYIVLIPFNVN